MRGHVLRLVGAGALVLLLVGAGPDSGYRGTQTQVVFASTYRDGSATCGIQEAIDSCGSYFAGGCEVQLPRGDCTLTDTITVGELGVAPKAGLVIKGHGDGHESVPGDDSSAGTALRWGGASGGTVLELFGVRHSTFSNFTIDCDAVDGGGNSAALGIDLRGENTAGTIVTRNSFRDITIEDCGGGSGVGMRIGDNAGDDSQADQTIMERVLMKDNDTCLLVDSANADVINLFGVHCEAYTDFGFDLVDGDVWIFGGAIITGSADNATSCAVRIGDAMHVVASYGMDIEVDDGDGFCTTGTTRQRVTTLVGNSIGIGGSNSVGVDADGQDAIDYRHGGALTLTGNEFLRRGQAGSDGDPIDVFIDNGTGGTLLLIDQANYRPSYIVNKIDRASAGDLQYNNGSNSDTRGPSYWGNQNTASTNTGAEICAQWGLTCMDVTDFPSGVATRIDCTTTAVGVPDPNGGMFLANCR